MKKILFGLNNVEVVNDICNCYKEKFGDTIEQKVVFYFKALYEELANGNHYDIIIFHEDLEPFAGNNSEVIDTYLFENIDKITDEAGKSTIIYICNERRTIGDKFLKKLFNIGIYNILIGKNRTKEDVAQLINQPRNKKQAKEYISVDSSYDEYSSNSDVNEIEIQRILSYYEKLSDDNQILEAFNKITEQYNNAQLRVISNFLPQRIKDILNLKSEKYKSIINFDINKAKLEPAIEKKPEIIKQIVVSNAPQQVKTEVNTVIQKEVIEKEIIKQIYEIPKDYKRVIAFVGTPKSGTSFIINILANYFSSKQLNVSIIDMTRKRDFYYLNTGDNDQLKHVAYESLTMLSNGYNEPLKVDNISIYTALPQTERKTYNHKRIIERSKIDSQIVLIDCDFSTPLDYFQMADEIFVVQDMEILNVYQNTSFIRELKARDISIEKIKIIFNKFINCDVSTKLLLEALSYYQNPELSLFDKLFEYNKMNYFVIPFQEENYKEYINSVYRNKYYLKDFTKELKESIYLIANNIYPINRQQKQLSKNEGRFLNIFTKYLKRN